MKILLWKIGALGDVLMTTPLLRQLRASYPDATIDYLVGQSSAAVLRGNPHLDQLHLFDEKIFYQRQIGRLHVLARRMRSYDAVFVLDKHWIFALVAALSGVPKRIGFQRTRLEGLLHTGRVPYGALAHEVDYYLSLGAAFGMAVEAADVALDVPESSPYPIDGPYTVLVNSGGAHVFEQSNIRQLPETLFAQLVNECSRSGRVVFLGTQAERATYEKFATDTTLNLCGQTDLRQVWHILQHAQAVYTTDTGLMHMAGALNANVTALFGPTHPERKCPPRATWVWKDSSRYDARYELFGKLPAQTYFSTMSVRDILGERRA